MTSVTGTRPAARVALLALGACAMVVGLLMLSGPDRGSTMLLAATVLTAGGVVLVFLGRLRLRPRPPAIVSIVAVAVVGTAAGLLRATESLCCMFAYLVGRGYPFEWLRRGDSAETEAAARAETLQKSWNPHWDAFAVDLAFWAAVGLLLVVAVALARRARH